MKIKELDENYSTVTSVGNIEYTTNPKKIRLKKRRKDDENHSDTIATIERENNKGWRFKTSEKWNEHNLPHMGHVMNKKIKRKGQKTIEKEIEDTLKELGVNYDSIEHESDEQ